MAKPMMQLLAGDIAMDIGTANSVVYLKNEGIVLSEPSVVALEVSDAGSTIHSVGSEARQLVGREPKNVETVRPLRDGVIADFQIAQEMIKTLIERAWQGRPLFGANMVVGVPAGATTVERRAISESCLKAGARQVRLIDETVAAAIGAGIALDEPCGSMVVDIGGGTTEVAVLSFTGVVHTESLRLAGDRMDEVLVDHFRRERNLIIGESTAERIKIEIGAAKSTCAPGSMELTCRDARLGGVRRVQVCEQDVVDALAQSVSQIVDAISVALEATPPELLSDVAERGVILTGGGAMLRGLDEEIRSRLDVPVSVADEPLSCVARGCGKVLENPGWWRQMPASRNPSLN